MALQLIRLRLKAEDNELSASIDRIQLRISELISAGIEFITVTLVEAKGSAPQIIGAKMIVNSAGLVDGTIGGGKIELKAIEIAQQFLESHTSSFQPLMRWNLQKDIGMSCGGEVSLFFERFGSPAWKIAVFGAGHVSQALCRTLLTLDCQIHCIDHRDEWLNRLPSSSRLRVEKHQHSADVVASLDSRTFIVCMTQGHATDFPVVLAALQRGSFPFVGVLGSVGKSVKLRKKLLEAGVDKQSMSILHCPLGMPFGRNVPEEIAISISAQLLAERDRTDVIFQKQKRFLCKTSPIPPTRSPHAIDAHQR